MKTIKLQLYILLSLICISSTSCGSDNENEKPSIIGEWTTIQRTVRTNYEDVDKEINKYLAQDIEKNNLIRKFDEKQVTTSAISKETGKTTRRKTEYYELNNNILYIEDISINAKTESIYTISYKRLTTTRPIDETSLRVILLEVGGYDPNQMPEDIKGELTISEAR